MEILIGYNFGLKCLNKRLSDFMFIYEFFRKVWKFFFLVFKFVFVFINWLNEEGFCGCYFVFIEFVLF